MKGTYAIVNSCQAPGLTGDRPVKTAGTSIVGGESDELHP